MVNKIRKELGMGRAITRRDFVYGAGLLVGGAMAGAHVSASAASGAMPDYPFEVGQDWYGPGGMGDYAASHGNTPGVIQAAHEIRAGRFIERPSEVLDTGESFDLVVVGGGFSGLSATHHFCRLQPGGRALILDNHPIFGGEAKRNDFEVNGVRISGPQGSNDCRVQPPTGDPDDYFTALNIPRELNYVEPQGAAEGLRIPTDNYDYLHWKQHQFDVGHHFQGASSPWVKNIWGPGMGSTPWSHELQKNFKRVRQTAAQAPPGHDLNAWLDSMTMKQYLVDVLGMPAEVATYYDPIMASIIGLGCDAISAYWGLYFRMPGFVVPDNDEGRPLDSFPGGNAAIARHFVKNLIPDAIQGADFESVLFGKIAFDELDKAGNAVQMRLRSTAVRVEHLPGGKQVAVYYLHEGKVYRVKAKAVVMGSGGWVNRHVIRDLPRAYHAAYDEFAHSPVLVANVALTNWRFLERLGISAAIWSGGFGFTCNIRRPMIVGGSAQPLHPDQPIVLTFYAPIYKPGLPRKQQGIAGRVELLTTSFADYEQQIRTQMVEMFSAGGFNPNTDIAGIILNRWGHAYTNPGPGFQVGVGGNPSPPDVIRQPIGRIAIGHSELRGHQYWTGAAGEGRRAVEALLENYF